MKLNFCTLFNSNYLTRGIAMYQSLSEHCNNFHLYIIPFDETCFKVLNYLNLNNITLIPLNEFEDEALTRVKSGRTDAEYCWTCTSSSILFCINKYNLTHCTYIDADIYFYSNPKMLIEEMGASSVLITDHRYAPEYDQSKESGKYCVQFICFKNDDNGMKALKWWRDACINWCFSRIEDGKFGDQKYLDDWTTRFNGVHELQHLGGGIAPWNAKEYLFKQINGKTEAMEVKTQKMFNVVFYHFHSLNFYDDDIVSLSAPLYLLNDNVITIFYKPYVRKLIELKNNIVAIDNTFNPNGSEGKAHQFQSSLLTKVKQFIISVLSNFTGRNNIKPSPHYNYYYRCNNFIQ